MKKILEEHINNNIDAHRSLLKINKYIEQAIDIITKKN